MAAEQRSVFPGFADLTDDLAEVVSLLAARRRAEGLSQTEVAARMGTSQPAIARLEAGAVDVRMSTLQRYADAIGQHLRVALASHDDGSASDR